MNRLFIENPIGAIIQKVRSKEISPENVLSASLENIKELNSKFFPFEAYRDERWKPREPRAPMDGHVIPSALLENIPVAIKDIYNTYDFPTQMGSPLWRGFTPGNDPRPVHPLQP